MAQTTEAEKTRLPAENAHRLAAAESRQPSQLHRKSGDRQDAGQEDRHRDAKHAEPQDQPGAHGSGMDGAIDAGRKRDQQHDQACRQDQLEGGRKPFGNDGKGRALIKVRDAEIAVGGAFQIAAELHRPGPIEPELVAESGPFGLGDGCAGHLPHGIAEAGADGKGDHQDRQHDEERLHQTAKQKYQRLAEDIHRRALRYFMTRSPR